MEPSPTLLGRTEEVASLAKAVADLTAGRGSAALVRGEAGIGKTSLLEAVLRAPPPGELAVFRGAGHDLEHDRPFGPLIDALELRGSSSDERRAATAGLLADPVAAGAGPGRAPELRYRIAEGIVEIIEEATTSAPALLVVEDLHWADASTLLVLRRLLPLVTQLPLALLLTTRPYPSSRDLDRLVDDAVRTGSPLLELAPLGEEALEALVRAQLGIVPGPHLRQQLVASGGNPLYASELLTALAADGALEERDGVVDVAERTLPPSLRLTILRGLSNLDEAGVELLKLAAVLGTSFSLVDLSVVSGRSVVELTSTLGAAVSSGVLRPAGDRFSFRHELVRDALYEDLPLPSRKGLHLEVARSLADAGNPPTQVAAHFGVAAPRGDAVAVRWLREAAATALGRDPQAARALLQLALDLSEGTEEADPVAVELLGALTWSGREEEATRTAIELLERHQPPEVEVKIRMMLANALFLQSRMAEAVEQCELAVQSPTLSDVARAEVLGRLAATRIWAGDIEGGERAARKAVEAGRRAGSDLAACLGLSNAGWASYLRGRTSEAITRSTSAAEISARTRDPQAKRAVMAHTSLAFMLTEADRFEEAETALASGRRVGDEVGRVWDLPLAHYYNGYLRFLRGRWDEAAPELEAGLAIAREVEVPLGSIFASCLLSVMAIREGDLAEGEQALAVGEDEARTRAIVDFEASYLAWPRALLLESGGRLGEALEVLGDAWDRAVRIGYLSLRRVFGPDLIRLARAAGDGATADAAARELLEAADLSGAPSVQAAALHASGVIAADVQALLASVEAYRSTDRVLEGAAAEEDAGRVLLEVGGRDEEALALLREAIDVYERTGASREADRLTAELRKRGVRRGRRGPRRKTRTGWESLTPSELKVLGLVAEGLSNRQIADRLYISRHTVESHVSHVLQKLEATSRAELAARWARRARDPDPTAVAPADGA